MIVGGRAVRRIYWLLIAQMSLKQPKGIKIEKTVSCPPILMLKKASKAGKFTKSLFLKASESYRSNMDWN